MTTETTTTIRRLNDALRTTFTGGRVMMTNTVAALPLEKHAAIFHAVQTFNAFDHGIDPHHEHDMGRVEVGGESYYWKIDYYDHDMMHGSEHPEDPAQTVRVLTIMQVDEY